MDSISLYQDYATTTQSRGRLVAMLYKGCIKFMKLAIEQIEANNNEAKGRYINKAQDIITELNAVLDIDAGGSIAANLRRLYLYMNKRLSEANIRRDPKIIREVIELMEELNKGWTAIYG